MIGTPEEITTQAAPQRAAAPARPALDAAEAARQDAFDFEPVWKGVALHPFSISRETFFLQLRLANGAPDFYASARDGESFFADAVRILYLCLHEPEDWRAHRGDLVALQEKLIDPWADEHLTLADKAPAVLLALRIWNANRATEAEPAPADLPGRGAEPGN